jgi:hypothetical protein
MKRDFLLFICCRDSLKYKIYPEGNRPPGKPSRGWEDNIQMDFQEVGCGGMDWIDLAKDRYRWLALVNVVMDLLVP